MMKRFPRKCIPPCDEIYVWITHPWERAKVPLDEWIKRGPGRRFLISVCGVCCKDGTELPMSVVPWKYRNTLLSHLLIRLGVMTSPWKDIPEGEGLT